MAFKKNTPAAAPKETEETKEAFVHEENRGSAFTNDKASKDTDPSYLGTANIGGELFRFVVWTNEYKEGKERLSFKFETEEEFQAKKAEREAANGGGAGRGKASAAAGRGGSAGRGNTRRNY
jgi:hypothetical protein